MLITRSNFLSTNLFVVVGDVGGEVGGYAVAAHEDVVLVLTQRSGAEPQRALFFLDITAFLSRAMAFSYWPF